MNDTAALRNGSPAPGAADGALGTCGITYDLGAELARNELTRPASHAVYYRDELIAIRDHLHGTKVDLYGSDAVQLVAGLDTAADLGTEPEMRARLATVAIAAERVRNVGIPIVLDVGCEYLLFSDGLIEGDDFFEKVDTITSDNLD